MGQQMQHLSMFSLIVQMIFQIGLLDLPLMAKEVGQTKVAKKLSKIPKKYLIDFLVSYILL
jgi:hypothetical protein